MKCTISYSIFVALLAALAASTANGFSFGIGAGVQPRASTTRLREQEEGAGPDADTGSTGRPNFDFSFVIPKKGIADVGTAEVSLPPILESSELIVVRYDLPFGLSAEPQGGQVIVTKDGKEDGEKVGDILRQTTYWRGSTPGLFDVSKNADNFDLVVQALVTNDLAVADEIVLVFERPC